MEEDQLIFKKLTDVLRNLAQGLTNYSSCVRTYVRTSKIGGTVKYFITSTSWYLQDCNAVYTMLFIYYLIFGTKYSRMDQVKFFKGYLPQILLGLFLDTLSHLLTH